MPATASPAALPRAVPACALDLLKRFEGLHDGDRKTPFILEPQADPIGIYTVGWGYALFDAGRPVKNRGQAMRIWAERWPNGLTRDDADDLLKVVAQDVCTRILGLTAPVTMNDNELGALVSLAYNIGVGEVGGAADFADSTVRRRILAGDRHGAADAFLMWNRAGGRILAGLQRRRAAERDLFLRPV